mgnify:CR=1 FL=1
MVRMDKESAEQLLKGKSAREVYEIVRDLIDKLPDAKIQDLDDTLNWVINEGYATAEELDAVEDEGGRHHAGRLSDGMIGDGKKV